MGNMQGTCGALSGALMVLSYVNSSGQTEAGTPKSKGETYQKARVLDDKFITVNGSMICQDLKTKGPGFVPCEVCIARACDILAKELNSQK